MNLLTLFVNGISVRIINEERRIYIQGLVYEIYKKDIKKRVKIKNLKTFNLVRNYIINNYGACTSINIIVNDLNKSGTPIRGQTVAKYIQHLVDAKLLYECERFDMKSRRMLFDEKKYYLADLSLTSITNPNGRINYGPALENMSIFTLKVKNMKFLLGELENWNVTSS